MSGQLALKHRGNRSQKQRIVVFCCSPIREDEKTLVDLARKMKKSAVSIDFVAFGELDGENTKKLEAFNENVKGGAGSFLAIVPPGPHLLSDAIVATPIVGGEGGVGGESSGMGGGAADSGGGGAGGFEFGVDPSTEPELALALRMSFEEEKARLEKEQQEREANEAKTSLDRILEEGSNHEPTEDKSAGGGSSANDKRDEGGDSMDIDG